MECLNQCWFASLDEINDQLQQWSLLYNYDRPHRSVGCQSPEAYEIANKNFSFDVVAGLGKPTNTTSIRSDCATPPGTSAPAPLYFHLIPHPALGYCFSGLGWPASMASMAARRSSPVTGLPERGRLSSNRPR